jgi:uncharacterized membrane protein YphA (DoxX/SURF4 family)
VLFAFGVWADLGALGLGVLLLPTAVVMHAYWRERDPQARAAEQIQFNKDISLAGAAIMAFGVRRGIRERTRIHAHPAIDRLGVALRPEGEPR